MRLNNFILDENRGVPMNTLSGAANKIKSKCKKSLDYYLKTGRSILRGAYYSVPGNTAIEIDPSKHERKSANTWNYYTLILDNDPRWKAYPKRSQSIICTTNYYKAKQYGTSFMVFPYDGSVIGVCPEEDIWESFRNSIGNMTLGQVARELNNLFDYADISVNDSDYNSFMKGLDKLDDSIEGLYGALKGTTYRTGIDIIERWDFQGSFKKWLLDLFDPRINNFVAAKNVDTVFSVGKANKEVWTDGKSILWPLEINIKAHLQ